MSYQSNPLSSFSFNRQEPSLLAIVLTVVILHVILLIFGTFWEPTHPEPKKKSKIIVQTVRLKPPQPEVAQHAIPSRIASPIAQTPLPIEKTQIELPVPEQVKEAPLPQAEAINSKDKTPPIQEIAAITETAPVIQPTEPLPTPAAAPASTPVAPSKTEIKPQPKISTPKPLPKEPPKKPPQPTAPVKKQIEPAKTTVKTDPLKQKQAEEAEKKRQMEQAEKKKQQEKDEAEKKRQKEIAEAEKKRQQEIAAVQEAAKQKQQAALAKANESLAKMKQTRDKISTSPTVKLETTPLPKELASLHVDALSLEGPNGSSNWGTRETNYSEEVAYRLKMNLKLPDYGAVKIKLTLDRTGKVKKLEIIKSESNKNKAYVESKIPSLIFSPFGQKFQGTLENTFVITLQNDS